MALSDNMINTAAAVLETAQRSRVPAPPLTESYPGFTQGDATRFSRSTWTAGWRKDASSLATRSG